MDQDTKQWIATLFTTRNVIAVVAVLIFVPQNFGKDFSIPVMCSMGGGYSPDIKIIIESHANTFRLAQEIFF